jgi:hypothetical protein
MFHVQRWASGALHDCPTTDPGNLRLQVLGGWEKEMNWGVHWDYRIAVSVIAIALIVMVGFFLYLGL